MGGLIPIANENGKVVKIKVYIKVLRYLELGQRMNRVAKFIKTLILVLLYLRASESSSSAFDYLFIPHRK